LNNRTPEIFDTLETIFVVTVLFFSTGALLPFVGGTSTSAVELDQGSPVTQIVWTVLYAITALLALTQWRRIAFVVMRDKLLLLLVGIAVMSVLWSAEPELTLRRSVTLAATTLFSAYVTVRYSLHELLRLLAWALGVAALLSLVFALALPNYGIYVDPRGEAWRGIFWHKNALGSNATLSALVFLCVALGAHKRRWIAWGGVGLSMVLLFLSESMTPFVGFIAVLALYPLYKMLRWRHILVVPFFVIVVLTCAIVTALLLTYSDVILSALERDPTLSGRTELWSAVLAMIRERLWLGYGYEAFWLGWIGESSHVLLWMIAMADSYGHGAADNGYLELWLSLGLLGVLVYLCAYVRTFFRAVRSARLTSTPEGLWPLLLLTFVLIYNLSEGGILAHNNIFWILYSQAQLSMVPQQVENPIGGLLRGQLGGRLR
jgi:exopolysaccharide production protein ExoQ